MSAWGGNTGRAESSNKGAEQVHAAMRWCSTQLAAAALPARCLGMRSAGCTLEMALHAAAHAEPDGSSADTGRASPEGTSGSSSSSSCIRHRKRRVTPRMYSLGCCRLFRRFWQMRICGGRHRGGEIRGLVRSSHRSATGAGLALLDQPL